MDLPLHERLYRRLRDLISSGALEHGTRIAPSRALAASLGISRNSVVTALERLIGDGFLESRRNSGMFVSYFGVPVIAAENHGAHGHTDRRAFAHGWANDIFPVEVWKRLQLRSWRNMPDLALQQSNLLGLPVLRKAIASHLAVTRGLTCTPAQVIVTTSIPAAIDLAVRALDLAGREGWVEEPHCRAPYNALRKAGVKTIPIAVDDGGIDVAAGISQAPHARMALVTPTCQVPTGVTLRDERRNFLLRWADDNASWIFEDDFNWNGDGIARSIRPLAARDSKHTLYFNSFNNILFSGLRIAYVVVPEATIEHFTTARGSEGDVNTPNQLVLTDFIESGYFDEHIRNSEAANASRRAALLSSVREELSGFLTPWNNPGGYFICGLRNQREIEFVQKCASAGVVVNPMSEHRASPGRSDVITLGFSQFSPEEIAQAARRLRNALEPNKEN